MKTIKKALGFFFIAVGIMILFLTIISHTDSTGANILLFILGLIPLIVGIALIKAKKDDKDDMEKADDISPIEEKPQRYRNHYIDKFKVAGISHHQKEIIDNFMDDSDLWTWSKQDIIEYDHVEEKMTRYESGPVSAQLVPDPDNQYDPNAIKVLVDNIPIGFVPAEDTGRIKKILEENHPEIICEFYGGPYKILIEDYDDLTDKSSYRMETHDDYIGAMITLK